MKGEVITRGASGRWEAMERARIAIIGLAFALAALMVCSPLLVESAHAYSFTGYKMPKAIQTIYHGAGVSGKYKTALDSACAAYTKKTKVSLKKAAGANVVWQAKVANYGNTKWEGLTTINKANSNKVIASCESKVNTRYVSGKNSSYLAVLWMHELGHGWGLGHVPINKYVMYTNVATPYAGGVRTLTGDEIAGINKRY